MAGVRFVQDRERVLYPSTLDELRRHSTREPPSMESAGPRERIFFEPSALACGIVTCGGLCPGLAGAVD